MVDWCVDSVTVSLSGWLTGVLAQCAAEADLDLDEARRVLSSDAYYAEVCQTLTLTA